MTTVDRRKVIVRFPSNLTNEDLAILKRLIETWFRHRPGSALFGHFTAGEMERRAEEKPRKGKKPSGRRRFRERLGPKTKGGGGKRRELR